MPFIFLQIGMAFVSLQLQLPRLNIADAAAYPLENSAESSFTTFTRKRKLGPVGNLITSRQMKGFHSAKAQKKENGINYFFEAAECEILLVYKWNKVFECMTVCGIRAKRKHFF